MTYIIRNDKDRKELREAGYCIYQDRYSNRILASQFHYPKFRPGTQVELGTDSGYFCARCGAECS